MTDKERERRQRQSLHDREQEQCRRDLHLHDEAVLRPSATLADDDLLDGADEVSKFLKKKGLKNIGAERCLPLPRCAWPYAS
jgi:hypothetical protein